jgi:hypothetical protein
LLIFYGPFYLAPSSGRDDCSDEQQHFSGDYRMEGFEKSPVPSACLKGSFFSPGESSMIAALGIRQRNVRFLPLFRNCVAANVRVKFAPGGAPRAKP